MNYLAHFHLAWPDEQLVAGALEGDYFKGLLPKNPPAPLEAGIKLHRSIDAYTDTHPLVSSLRCEFTPSLRRYAGILIDLSFDHYLSIHWEKYSDIPLSEFNTAVLKKLQLHRAALSENANKMAQRLEEFDILNLYLDWETVPATARRVGQRFKQFNPFYAIDAELADMRDEIEKTFLAFYPQLLVFSQQQLPHLSTPSNIALAAKKS